MNPLRLPSQGQAVVALKVRSHVLFTFNLNKNPQNWEFLFIRAKELGSKVGHTHKDLPR